MTQSESGDSRQEGFTGSARGFMKGVKKEGGDLGEQQNPGLKVVRRWKEEEQTTGQEALEGAYSSLCRDPSFEPGRHRRQ